MIQNLLLLLILLSSFMFTQLMHPLSLTLMLMYQTMFICLLTGMLNQSYWFSYILYMIFLGSLLILFIYITSLTSNEIFYLSVNLMMNLLLLMVIYMMMLNLYDNMIINNMFMMKMSFFLENFNSMKLFNFPTNMITIMLMTYLLINLIIIVKMININFGPLRHMLN